MSTETYFAKHLGLLKIVWKILSFRLLIHKRVGPRLPSRASGPSRKTNFLSSTLLIQLLKISFTSCIPYSLQRLSHTQFCFIKKSLLMLLKPLPLSTSVLPSWGCKSHRFQRKIMYFEGYRLQTSWRIWKPAEVTKCFLNAGKWFASGLHPRTPLGELTVTPPRPPIW